MTTTQNIPTPRQAQDAAAIVGDEMVDRITQGRGLSGASAPELWALVGLAGITVESN